MAGKHILKDVDCFISRSGGESFLVDPAGIKVREGWNKREDFSGEEELMSVIKNLQVPPILVRKNKANELELIDGHRRLNATMRLISEGVELPGIRVAVAPAKMNDIDLCFLAISSNGGKPLLPIEQANWFKQLSSWGVPKQMIADKCGVSLSTVRNRLELSNAIPQVKEAVKNNDISIKKASEIIDKSDGNVEKQVEQLKVAKATPRTRAVIIQYQGDELCKGISCPMFSRENPDCRHNDNTCIMTALELFRWLKDDGWTISKKAIKDPSKEV